MLVKEHLALLARWAPNGHTRALAGFGGAVSHDSRNWIHTLHAVQNERHRGRAGRRYASYHERQRQGGASQGSGARWQGGS